jgi:Flp pilus assembly protein TadD
LHEAITRSPADPFASWLLAACFEKEGSLPQAEAHYRRAVADARFPDPKLLTDWGRVLERMARPDEAREAYRRAALLR